MSMSVWHRLRGLVRSMTGLWYERKLTRDCWKAQYRLGEQMYAAGIDDGQLGGQIATLDEQLPRPGATETAGKALRAAGEKLILGLAAAALETEAPLPGAEVEYQQVRECQAALRAHTQQRLGPKTVAGPWWTDQGSQRPAVATAASSAT